MAFVSNESKPSSLSSNIMFSLHIWFSNSISTALSANTLTVLKFSFISINKSKAEEDGLFNFSCSVHVPLHSFYFILVLYFSLASKLLLISSL